MTAQPVETDAAVKLRLYTVNDAAELLACSAGHVRDLVRAGKLPVVELGSGSRSKLRIRADHLAAFIEARTV